MSNKKQKAYQHVLQFINSNLLEMKPKSFTTDFENGMRNAIKTIFPECRLKGCWFHFCQALRRRALMMKDFGSLIKRDTHAKRIFQKLMAIPLLEPKDIIQGFNIIQHEAYSIPSYRDVFEQFFTYFERQWIEKETPQQLSLHNENVRTTSALEGYNSYLSSLIPTHGSFWDFLKVIKQEEFQKHNELSLALDGVYDVFERPKKKFKNQAHIIRELTVKLDNKSISLPIFLQSITNRKNNILPSEETLNLNEEVETGNEEEIATPVVDGLLCEVCYKNKKNTIFKPCKHGKICRSCFDKINKHHQETGTLTLCPFCRQIVGSVEEFFI